MKVCVDFEWEPAGAIRIDWSGKLEFPPLTAEPGIYRIRFTDGTKSSAYIGESDNLRRRAGNYRNPGPTQQTSKRVNALLLAAAARGSLEMAFARQAPVVTIDGDAIAPDLTRKPFRVLIEHAALVQAVNDGADEILNL